jgi:hemoglobin
MGYTGVTSFPVRAALGKASLLSTLCIGLFFGIHASLGDDPSLYHRLGGREQMRPIVGDFVDVVLHDSRLRLNSNAKKLFDHSDSGDFKGKLMDIACEAAGGPCRAPTARASLHAALVSLDLTPMDWNSIKSDLSACLMNFSVPSHEQSELMALLEGAR